MKTGFAFHCHHDTLVEWVTDYDERVKYIKENKPESEQELRLRLFKMIPPDRLPPELYKAGDDYDKALDAYNKAGDAYNKAWDACTKARPAYDKAWAAYLPALIALHKELCPNCPWDGNTIFTEKESK